MAATIPNPIPLVLNTTQATHYLETHLNPPVNIKNAIMNVCPQPDLIFDVCELNLDQKDALVRQGIATPIPAQAPWHHTQRSSQNGKSDNHYDLA
ncbi:MAG: hypothetical protein AAGJ35_15440 [Myxococcota bacterium]